MQTRLKKQACQARGWLSLALAILGLVDLIGCTPTPEDNPSNSNSPLKLAINACDGITEKAALGLPPPVVEFQKLEYAGRKARVFRLCMHDRGYVENPVWTSYARPLAEQHAQSGQISKDEAIENLRRVDMMRLMPASNVPEYWAPISKPSAS